LYVPAEVPATLAIGRNLSSQSACKLRVSCRISRRYHFHKDDRLCFGSEYESDTDVSDGFQIDSLFFVYGTLVEQSLFTADRRRAGSSSELGRRPIPPVRYFGAS